VKSECKQHCVRRIHHCTRLGCLQYHRHNDRNAPTDTGCGAIFPYYTLADLTPETSAVHDVSHPTHSAEMSRPKVYIPSITLNTDKNCISSF
jgi:hypothetical protein